MHDNCGNQWTIYTVCKVNWNMGYLKHTKCQVTFWRLHMELNIYEFGKQRKGI